MLIDVEGTGVRGSDVFSEIVSKIDKIHGAENIKFFYAEWGDLYPDNLNTFNRLLRENPNMSLEDAARATFSGKMAERHGFTKIENIHKVGDRGNYTEVNVNFER